MPIRLILVNDTQRLGVDLKDGVYRIGREKPADIVVSNGTVSSRHAELQVDGSSVQLRDLGSTNGTFVNGNRIRAATPITSRDEVLIGSVKLLLEEAISAPKAQPASPAAAAAPPTPGGTIRVEPVKAPGGAASKLKWTVRYWIAAVEAIIVLLALFLFMQLYDNSARNEERTRTTLRFFAEQYVQVLGNPALRPIPAPRLDDSLGDPIYITDADGTQLFPQPDPDPAARKPVPIIDPKTKKIYESARYGFFKIPGTASDAKVYSYPVRSGGDLLGFVIAHPTGAAEVPVGPLAFLTLLGGAVSIIIVSFTLRRVHGQFRDQITTLDSKINPLANGFVSELPRSDFVPELNQLAADVEAALRTVRTAASGAAGGGKAAAASEYAPLVVDLADRAGILHCFTDGDFKIVNMNAQLTKLTEFSRASVGQSIFDAGMNAFQSKQLVQAMADAKREGTATLRLSFTRQGDSIDFVLTLRAQKKPGSDQPLIGIILEPVP